VRRNPIGRAPVRECGEALGEPPVALDLLQKRPPQWIAAGEAAGRIIKRAGEAHGGGDKAA
jgi:hypothetical protein